MNNDNNQPETAEINDLPVDGAIEIAADVVNAAEVAADAPDTDELPTVSTEDGTV